MKKLLALILFATLCVGCLSIFAFAADEGYSAETWEGVKLEGLFYQDGEYINSDLAENYEAWWWEGDVPEIDDYVIAAYVNMRGFAMSADGRYAYLGVLNGGTGVRGVSVLDTQVGKITDLYYSYDEVNGLPGSPFSWAKGIAADDRGYVYVGFAYSVNYNYVSLGITQQGDDGKLIKVSQIPVYQNEWQPGDEAGTKVGVNGVEVAKVGDKYLCFVMVNYDYDCLYCYDVTDPANPVLNTSWGIEGMINFADPDCTIDMDGKTLKEGQYMAVDADGTVWLCVDFNEGSNGIVKIDPTGITCQSVIAKDGAYCVTHVGKHLLVGMKDGSAVAVLDDSTGEEVANIEVPDAARISRVQVVNDTLYVCGSGQDSFTWNYIYAAALTSDAQAALDAQVAQLDKYRQEDDTGEQTTEEVTEPDATDAETEKPTEETTETPTTNAPATEEPTDQPEAEGGCGSIIGGSIFAILTLLGVAFVAKKKD